MRINGHDSDYADTMTAPPPAEASSHFLEDAPPRDRSVLWLGVLAAVLALSAFALVVIATRPAHAACVVTTSWI